MLPSATDPLEAILTHLVSSARHGNAETARQLQRLAECPPLQDLARSFHQDQSSLFSRLVSDMRNEVCRYVHGISTIRARLALHAALSG